MYGMFQYPAVWSAYITRSHLLFDTILLIIVHSTTQISPIGQSG